MGSRVNFAMQKSLGADVGYGSKASFPAPSRHVRSYPVSDRHSDLAVGRFVLLATKVRCSNFGEHLAASSGLLDSSIDLAAERHEVDWLGQERFRAPFQCLALGILVAIGRDHDDRHVRPHGLRFGQKLKAGHPRHIDVRQDEDQRDALRVADALQRCRSRLGKFHHKPAAAEVAPKLLAKQHLNVWLVVDHENKQTHARPPALVKV